MRVIRFAGLLVALALVLLGNVQFAATVFPDTTGMVGDPVPVTGSSATIVRGAGAHGCE